MYQGRDISPESSPPYLELFPSRPDVADIKFVMRMCIFIVYSYGWPMKALVLEEYNKLVYKPKSELLKPSLLYIITETVTTKA